MERWVVTMSKMVQINPATGEQVAEIAEMTEADVLQAMQRAREAWPSWAATPLAERLRRMRKLRGYLVEHAREISDRIAVCTGKVHLEALVLDVFTVADMLHYYETHAEQFLRPERVGTPLVYAGNRSYVEYKPMGVVAVIAPWNFPFQLAMIPALSAVIAGNCALIKPSEVTPGVGVLIEEIAAAAGLPRDVLQVVHGGRETGRALVEARPDKVMFTGSVATGKKIMSACAEHLIPVELELGGKDAMIVFADSDLDRAAEAAVWGAFANAGQVCMSIERLYVEQSVYDEFVRKVVARTEQLRMGVDYGSMTFAPQLELVQAHIADAVAHGARVECGGHPLQEGTLYMAPTVLTGTDHSMRVIREESFGPLLPIMPFSTEDEAVALANDSEYGLSGAVFSGDLEKARRVTSRLQCGMISINEVIATPGNPALPFGGVKHSGMGRYHGAVGLRTFCHQTSVMMSKGKKPREINWHPYTEQKEQAFYSLIRLLFGVKKRFADRKGLKAAVRELLGLYRRGSTDHGHKQATRTVDAPGQGRNNLPM